MGNSSSISLGSETGDDIGSDDHQPLGRKVRSSKDVRLVETPVISPANAISYTNSNVSEWYADELKAMKMCARVPVTMYDFGTVYYDTCSRSSVVIRKTLC